MSSVTERAVIYVDSGSDLSSMTSISSSSSSLSSPRHSPSSDRPSKSSHGQSNYVIKIQIGEERMFNTPVRIDVAASGGGNKKHQHQSNRNSMSMSNNGNSNIRCGQESPLNSSGQSSPRSDMTPPPLPRNSEKSGPMGFGSETSESDTESDVSSADLYHHSRPSSTSIHTRGGNNSTCSAAQFAMREILELGPPSIFNLSDIHLGSRKSSGGITKGKQIIMEEQEIQIPRDFASIKNSVNQSLMHCFSQGKRGGLVNNGGSKGVASHSPIIIKLKQHGGNGSCYDHTQHHQYQQKRPNRFRLIESAAVATAGGDIIQTEHMIVEYKSITDVAPTTNYVGNILVDENSFHLNEINECNGNVTNDVSVSGENADSLSNFVGYKDIFARNHREGPIQIMSDKGTIRGVKNRVRDGIATFLQSKDSKTFNEKEQGRVVVYVTSMGVVRDTFQRCQKVKQILRTLLVKFDERDCYMNRAVQDEIRERLPHPSFLKIQEVPLQPQNLLSSSNNANSTHSVLINNTPINLIALPQVFLEGQHLGDADTIEKLNETGELRDLLRPYKSLSVLSTCERCGGFRMLPCPVCNGSKKSVHRNHFTTEFIALKCMHCDPAGLIRCDLCNCKATGT